MVIMLKELVSLDQEADRKESNWHPHLSKTSLSINEQIISLKCKRKKIRCLILGCANVKMTPNVVLSPTRTQTKPDVI